MKTKMVLALAVLLLTTTAAFGDSAMGTGKGIFGKIMGDLTESTHAVHKINKENIATVKAEAKANFEEATVPSPSLDQFREAKGFGNKIKAIVEVIAEDMKLYIEKEKGYRAKLQSHEAYRAVLN